MIVTTGSYVQKDHLLISNVAIHLALLTPPEESVINRQYEDTAHPHALTHIDGMLRFLYDANGNMTGRNDASENPEYGQEFDVQNQLIEVSQSTLLFVNSFKYGDGENRTVSKTGAKPVIMKQNRAHD